MENSIRLVKELNLFCRYCNLWGVNVNFYRYLKFIVLLAAAPHAIALGHARLIGTALPPRSTADNLKVGPCGNVSAQMPTDLVAGQELKLDWEETINHPGWFEFRFSTDGIDFSNLLLKVTDTQNTTTDLPHKYQGVLKIPDATCENCVIQFIQVMTDSNPARNYYSCADVNIKSKSIPDPKQTPDSGIPTPKGNTPVVNPVNTPTVPVEPVKQNQKSGDAVKIETPANLKLKWREGK